MIYKRTTPVPNVLFDLHLPSLSESELKILLIVIRQTYGWADKRTGKRKTRDRISHFQFVRKTGLCRRVVSKAVQSLVEKELIVVTDRKGSLLHRPEDRKGKTWLLYSPKLTSEPVVTSKSSVTGVKSIGEALGRLGRRIGV